MSFPAPFPPEDPPDAPPGPPPPPDWWDYIDGRACGAQPIDEAEGVAVTSFRAFGRGDAPSEPYRGGTRRRRFGLDDGDQDPAQRFDRWREPEGR